MLFREPHEGNKPARLSAVPCLLNHSRREEREARKRGKSCCRGKFVQQGQVAQFVLEPTG